MGDELAPVIGLQNRAQSFRDLFLFGMLRTDGFHPQTETKLEVDLFAIFGQYGHRSGTDVAQANDAYVHLLHRLAMIASGFPRTDGGAATALPPRPGGEQIGRIARFRIAPARGVKAKPARREGPDRASLPQWVGSLRHPRRNRCRRRVRFLSPGDNAPRFPE